MRSTGAVAFDVWMLREMTGKHRNRKLSGSFARRSSPESGCVRTPDLAHRSVHVERSIPASRGSIPEIYMSLRMRHMAGWKHCD